MAISPTYVQIDAIVRRLKRVCRVADWRRTWMYYQEVVPRLCACDEDISRHLRQYANEGLSLYGAYSMLRDNNKVVRDRKEFDAFVEALFANPLATIVAERGKDGLFKAALEEPARLDGLLDVRDGEYGPYSELAKEVADELAGSGRYLKSAINGFMIEAGGLAAKTQSADAEEARDAKIELLNLILKAAFGAAMVSADVGQPTRTPEPEDFKIGLAFESERGDWRWMLSRIDPEFGLERMQITRSWTFDDDAVALGSAGAYSCMENGEPAELTLYAGSKQIDAFGILSAVPEPGEQTHISRFHCVIAQADDTDYNECDPDFQMCVYLHDDASTCGTLVRRPSGTDRFGATQYRYFLLGKNALGDPKLLKSLGVKQVQGPFALIDGDVIILGVNIPQDADAAQDAVDYAWLYNDSIVLRYSETGYSWSGA